MYVLLTFQKTPIGIQVLYNKKLYSSIDNIMDDINSKCAAGMVAVHVENFDNKHWGDTGTDVEFSDVLLLETCKGVMAGAITTDEIYVPLNLGLGDSYEWKFAGYITVRRVNHD